MRNLGWRVSDAPHTRGRRDISRSPSPSVILYFACYTCRRKDKIVMIKSQLMSGWNEILHISPRLPELFQKNSSSPTSLGYYKLCNTMIISIEVRDKPKYVRSEQQSYLKLATLPPHNTSKCRHTSRFVGGWSRGLNLQSIIVNCHTWQFVGGWSRDLKLREVRNNSLRFTKLQSHWRSVY